MEGGFGVRNPAWGGSALVGVGIAFVIIGVTGRRAFVLVGLVFIVAGVVLAKRRR
jgi:glucose dehydrogenase